MDTPTAISTLTSLQTNLKNLVVGYQAQIDALQVSIDQLNGILNTPAQDLQEADATIATLQAEVTAIPVATTPPTDSPAS